MTGLVGGEGASHPPSKPAFRHTPVSLNQIWPINSAPQPCEWQGCYSWTICLYRGIGVERSAGSSGLGQLGCVQRLKPSLAMRAVLSLPSTGGAQQPQTQSHIWGLVSGATGQWHFAQLTGWHGAPSAFRVSHCGPGVCPRQTAPMQLASLAQDWGWVEFVWEHVSSVTWISGECDLRVRGAGRCLGWEQVGCPVLCSAFLVFELLFLLLLDFSVLKSKENWTDYSRSKDRVTFCKPSLWTYIYLSSFFSIVG